MRIARAFVVVLALGIGMSPAQDRKEPPAKPDPNIPWGEAASFLFDAWISDVYTCLKLAPTQLWRTLGLRSNGFGIEAEVTGKLLARGLPIYEVPIRYRARSRVEGKKIRAADGLRGMGVLLRVRLLGR